ncbi:hypothetical protein [Aeromonas media]|uniref:hypothetical protein n=1 Tax=Aeromonas media TaxID=651 RepID=UPI0015F90DAD|nr:hypothetical protein [Aeromonas media]
MNDISKFRIAAPQVLETAIVPAVEQPILIQKPHPQEFIQMHAEQFPAQVIQWYQDDQYYLVHPEILQELQSETKLVCLSPWVTRTGEVGLWPISTHPSSWQSSAQAVIEQARTQWGRVKTNKGKDSYEFLAAVSQQGAPQWPDKTLDDLIATAFCDRLITSADHPVVRALRGQQDHA